MTETIILGSDHGGYNLKTEIKTYLENAGYEVCDVGCFSQESCDYPMIAKQVAEGVLRLSCRGILVCGTGIGMSIAANRFDGIRASVCSDTFTARMTRMHNNSNILCLGERVVGKGLALDIVEIWLKTDFEGGRHLKRIEMI
ncbi:MAG: ribose 5-phosphate isomerase B [bacterium]|nr:ribose 5-phosphate isomerase B [bacterium]